MARINAEYSTAQTELAQARVQLQAGRIAENSTSDYVNRRDIQRANGTRPAYAEITYVSTGTGQQRIRTPLEFPVIFREQPHFTSGSAVKKNPDASTWNDPIGTCGVYAWQRNKRGYYTGAFIWVRVDIYPIAATTATTPPPGLQTMHFLTFSGKAHKSIRQLEESIAALQARTPGIQ